MLSNHMLLVKSHSVWKQHLRIQTCQCSLPVQLAGNAGCEMLMLTGEMVEPRLGIRPDCPVAFC